MRFLIIDTCYPAFWQSLYKANPHLVHRSYEEQWRFYMNQFFGTADFYSSNLQKIGHEATEIIANCEPLQSQWIRENRVSLPKTVAKKKLLGFSIPWLAKEWFYPTLLSQAKKYKPDVLYIQDPANTAPSFVSEIRSFARLLVGQIACPIPPDSDFSGYDLMLSSLPNYVTQFRKQGLRSELFHLGFEPRILGELHDSRKIGSAVHIGGYGLDHANRNKLLESLIRAGIDLDCRGYGMQHVPSDSPIFSHYHGEAWGLEMYRVLRGAKIALNMHIDIAGDYANNMRLYESTGVGTLLITDWKRNLTDMFEPDKEVVVYRSVAECAEKVKYYLLHELERETIAQAGQRRTLREHTFLQRMQELVEILHRHL